MGFYIITATENYNEETCIKAESDTSASSESEIFDSWRDRERFIESENSQECATNI